MASVSALVPRYEDDLFTPEAIAHPWDHYRKMRDLGPVVWIDGLAVYALTRYADVRAALGDDERFISGKGVAFNEDLNQLIQGTMLASDGDVHQHLRTIVGRPLTPRALRGLRPDIEQASREIVDNALQHRTFDAVEVLAQALPVKIVPDLLGWEEDARPNLLKWGEAAFNSMGPDNELCAAARPAILEMFEYAKTVAEERRCAPDSLSAKVLESADKGEIDQEQCPALMIDYLGPSVDTTASALAAAFYLFSVHPDQWQTLREDPTLIPNALNEVLRWQSPLRAFTRLTSSDVDFDGVTIPAQSRVAVFYASANRDERFWERPDEFDITRENASRHVGFGYGPHSCAGQGLTRLEAETLIAELARRVVRFEPAGEAVPGLNNLIMSYSSVPVTAVLE